MTTKDYLAILPVFLVVLGVLPVLRRNGTARINLSVWTVIVFNAWLAAAGAAMSTPSGASTIYLFLNAVILSPVLVANLGKGVWGELPAWHKAAAGILPAGVFLGFASGGELATWSSCLASAMLTAQLVESSWRGLSREHIGTWSWFLLSDGSALVFGWGGAGIPVRTLLSLWVFQCFAVIALEARNRILHAPQPKDRRGRDATPKAVRGTVRKSLEGRLRRSGGHPSEKWRNTSNICQTYATTPRN